MKATFTPMRIFDLIWTALLLVLLLTASVVDAADQLERIRAYSRAYEFDYATWTVSALARKLAQASLGVEDYLSPEQGRQVVLDYLELKVRVDGLENQLTQAISAPDQAGRQQEAAIREQLGQLISERTARAPFVEQILQGQLNAALAELDLSLAGVPLPPVLYRFEPNSYALIVSPRDEISQLANIMLVRGLRLDQITALEESIEGSLDLSALVVGIGGVGLYPSMIIESGSLDWLIHVTSHEWTHNYLTLRPLGLAYSASPELTTINETVADLSADEIQRVVFQLYYPEFLPPEPTPEEAAPSPPQGSPEDQPEAAPEPPLFDFRAEMHTTRLEVDRLLAAGAIEEAEAYMEARRGFFWDNGYQIRRLNQAYFAFHGSYAAEPGGAASQEGVDLGAELRALKASTPSYREFMRLVSWRWRLDQFEALFSE